MCGMTQTLGKRYGTRTKRGSLGHGTETACAGGWKLRERSQRNQMPIIKGSIDEIKLRLDVIQEKPSDKSQPVKLSQGEVQKIDIPK